MNKPHLLQKLAPVGIGAIGAIAVTGIATAPARAFTLNEFHALGWDDGTSNFYNDAFDAFGTVGDQFTVTFCNPSQAPDCFATIEDAQGDYEDIFTPPSPGPGNVVDVLSPFPTATWENVAILPSNGFAARAEFELVNSPLVFSFERNEIPTTQTLPVGSRIQGEIELDEALEFELEAGVNNAGEWFLEIPDQAEFADRSVFEFGITSNQVTSGVYNAEAEIRHTPVPEPATILGLLTVGGLGLGLKRKKQLWKAS